MSVWNKEQKKGRCCPVAKAFSLSYKWSNMHSSWIEGTSTAHFDYKCQQKSIIGLRSSIKSHFWKIRTFLRDKVKQSGFNWNKFYNLQTLNVKTYLTSVRKDASFRFVFSLILLNNPSQIRGIKPASPCNNNNS